MTYLKVKYIPWEKKSPDRNPGYRLTACVPLGWSLSSDRTYNDPYVEVGKEGEDDEEQDESH